MKFYKNCILLALVFALFSCGSDKPDKLPSSNQRKSSPQPEDTPKVDDDDDEFVEELPFNIDSVTVILQEGEEGKQHILFVDNTNNPEYFRNICNFEMPSKFEISMYRNTYSLLQENINDTAKLDLSEVMNISKKWVPLVIYNEDYYYYHPAKLEYNHRVMITDTCLAVYNRHGVSAEVIKSVLSPHDNHYVLDVFATDDNENTIRKEINIYLIDTENRIAIWEEFCPSGIVYRLMIAETNSPIYPVIVNFGQGATPEEYQFDEINYFEEISKIVE